MREVARKRSGSSSARRTLKSPERSQRLRELFAKQEFADIEVLSSALGISESTIRRDLIALEQEGVLRRVHGGAISLQTRDETLDFGNLASSLVPEKQRIGRCAASLIENGQTVLAAGGSTVLEVARCLYGRNVQVITNALTTAQVFWDCKSVEVTLTGGYLYPRVGVLLGALCEHTLDQIEPDVLILGVGGLTYSGVTDSNSLIVSTVRKMIHVARKVIVVADRTKFGRKALVHIAGLGELDTIVSDAKPDDAFMQVLNDHKVELITA